LQQGFLVEGVCIGALPKTLAFFIDPPKFGCLASIKIKQVAIAQIAVYFLVKNAIFATP
jgi:hypothetical protein